MDFGELNAVFWDVTSYTLVDRWAISKKYIASIFRVEDCQQYRRQQVPPKCQQQSTRLHGITP
jgi:hypothetical protein